MPISLTFTEGSISNQNASMVAKKITQLFLQLHGLAENKVMGPGVTSHINILPKDFSLSNGEAFDGAWIEARVPSFALSSEALRKEFFSKAADLVEEFTEQKIKREDIHGSAIYAIDGAWMFHGAPQTNEEILQAVQQA